MKYYRRPNNKNANPLIIFYMCSKTSFSVSVLFSLAICLTAQVDVYHVNYKNEIGFVGAGIGLNILGSILAGNADESTIEEINALNASDIWDFDRGATTNFSSKAQAVSDIVLFSGAALPFIIYFSKNCRSEGAAIGVMAAETFLLTNGITNITKSIAKRYRPFNYNPEVDDAIKLGRGSRLSFFSGHVSNTAAMSFFAAKVLTDLHPDMENKYLVWATAATIPAVISYLRYEAGKHFPTDLITGYAVGATIGYLIPTLHLSKDVNLQFSGGSGFDIRINLN